MSAQPLEQSLDSVHTLGVEGTPTDGATPEPQAGGAAEDDASPRVVEVRRNAGVSLGLGTVAAALAIAYLWRAAQYAAPLDWLLCLGLTALAAGLLRGLVDARVPLLAADDLGIRFRLGNQWRGVPWEAVDRLEVTPRPGRLRDGRLVVRLHHQHRALEGLERRARRQARFNKRWYGAMIATPLGPTTRLQHATDDTLLARLEELARGRTDVVTLLADPEPLIPTADQAVAKAESVDGATHRVPQQAGPLAEPLAGPLVQPLAEPASPDAGVPDGESAAGDGRVRESAARSALAALTGRRPANVRPIAELAEPVVPPVIEDYVAQPAYDPVIGPELAAARTRVGLSVDELAVRTRIRPHVIESLEVDDFAPCGGDFYARGHLRTLARVLGKDPVPLLEQFDARYAAAPISPRKVFEAELASGTTGSMRSTAGGPHWFLLISMVITLVLVWSALRLLSVQPDPTLETPPPVLNGSAGLRSGFGGTATPAGPPPVATTVVAVNGGAHVTVRDGEGAVVYDGDLVIGEVKALRVDPPVTVSSDDGGVVAVTVGGREQGLLGEPNQPATRVFQRPGR